VLHEFANAIYIDMLSSVAIEAFGFQLDANDVYVEMLSSMAA